MKPVAVDPPVCSRAGCQQPASSRLHWRNPRIHDELRTKVWLACPEHREYLREYLAARSFPVTVFELAGSASGASDGAAAEGAAG